MTTGHSCGSRSHKACRGGRVVGLGGTAGAFLAFGLDIQWFCGASPIRRSKGVRCALLDVLVDHLPEPGLESSASGESASKGPRPAGIPVSGRLPDEPPGHRESPSPAK
jgi:hypothetical protein